MIEIITWQSDEKPENFVPILLQLESGEIVIGEYYFLYDHCFRTWNKKENKYEYINPKFWAAWPKGVFNEK